MSDLFIAAPYHDCNSLSLLVSNPGSVSAELHGPIHSDIHLQFITQHLVLVTCTCLSLLDPRRADQKIAKLNKQQPKLTFGWALQFPPPSFLTRCRQVVVLLVLAGQESVLLGRAQALTPGAVLCPARGRVTRDSVLHFPLLLFGEAGVRCPVSVPAHVSIVDLCHGRPSHPSVAVAAHTHTIFERATALDLQGREEEVEMLTSGQSFSFSDCYCSSTLFQFDIRRCSTVLCLSAVMTYYWIYCSQLCSKQNISGFTTNQPVHLRKGHLCE